MTKKFIDHPILDTLQDHKKQLTIILNTSKRVMVKFDRDKVIGHENALTERNLEVMDSILKNCLHSIGDYSMTRNLVEKELKDHYTKTYANSPAMGKNLFLKHYAELHKPYDKVKTYIWKSIFAVDEYKEKNF